MKRSDAPQYAIGVPVNGNATESERIGAKEQIGQDLARGPEHNIARPFHGSREKIVGGYLAFGGLNRLMISSPLCKEDVQSDGSCTLRRKFVHQPPVDMPWPMKAERQVRIQLTFAKQGDSVVADENKSEVGRDLRTHAAGLAHAPVESHPLQAGQEVPAAKQVRHEIKEQH